MPENESRHHRHPNNPQAFVFGKKLVAGDTLQRDDVYSSTNYQWERCTCPGLQLGEGNAVTWIRPEPCPRERELVQVGNVLMERRDVPPEPLPEDAPPDAENLEA